MKLSIITINYNNLEGLKKTYDSVVCQTWTDYEWIVIDGGSTDGSREFIEEHQDKFAYWCSEPDKGVYNAMNKGIAKAQGEYLNFMNSGDCFYEENTLEYIFLTDYVEDIIIGDAYWMQNGVEKKFCDASSGVYDMFFFLSSSVPHQAMFFRVECFERYGLYDENLKIVSDYKYSIDAIYFHKAATKYIPIKICKYEGRGISDNTSEMFIERNEVIDSFFPLRIREDMQHLNNYKLTHDLVVSNSFTRWIYWMLPKIARRTLWMKERLKHISSLFFAGKSVSCL